MWLVFCSNTNLGQTKEIIQNLSVYNPNTPISYIDALKLNGIPKNINYLTAIINNYDYVICTSPSCIEFTKLVIQNANKPSFMVMGRASHDLITKYTKRHVVYPNNLEGVDGLIIEVLNQQEFINKKILVLRGSGVSSADKLKHLPLNIDFLNIYESSYIALTVQDFSELFLINKVNVICITSSSLVKWLFEKCDIATKVSYLDEINFLVWHTKIADQLKKYNIKKIGRINYGR